MRSLRDRVRLVLVAASVSGILTGALQAQSIERAAHDVELEIGIGYDDNPFLTPDDPYFDQNQLQVIDPQRESGFYLPILLQGTLEVPQGQRGNGFVVDYHARGSFYADSETSNAEETYARIAPGFQFDLSGASGHDRTFLVTPFATYNKEVFFDRDNGSEFSGEEASNRYSYQGLGGEMELRLAATRWIGFSVEGRLESRDYEDAADFTSFDHDRYRAGAGMEIRFSRRARLELDYRYDRRTYDDRHARSLDGDDPDTNPNLEYGNLSIGATLRLRPVKSWTLYLDYDVTQRADEHVGYNDYDQDSVRIRSTIRRKTWSVRVAAKYWDRTFDRAFIFDHSTNPLDASPNPLKRYEAWDLDLETEMQWTQHLRLFARIDHRDQETADPRYGYVRTRTIAGVKWIL